MTATRKTDAKSTRKPTSSGTGAARSRATKTAAKASAAKTGTKAASKQKPAAPATPAPLASDPLFPPLPSAVLQTPRAREHFSRLTQPTPPSVPAAHEQPVVTDHADQLLTGQDAAAPTTAEPSTAEPSTAEPTTPATKTATTTSRGRSRRRAAATPAADTASDDAPSSAAARRSSRGRSRPKGSAQTKSGSQTKSSARPKSGGQTKGSARPTADVTTSGRGTPVDVGAPTPEQVPAPAPTLTSDVPATRTERPVTPDVPSTEVPSTDAASATDANTPGLSGTAAVARLDTFTQRLQALIRTFTPFHICQGGRVGGLAPEEVAEQVTRDHNRILDLFTQRDATEAALLGAMSGPSGEQGTKAALLSALRARGAVTRHDLYRHVAQQKTLHLDQLKKATETAERRIDQAINIPGESFEHLMKVLMPTSFDPLSYATRIDDLITEAMQDEQATDSAFDLYLASLTLTLP